LVAISVPSSFRDPSGFLFVRDKLLLRQVNELYREHYDLLMSSGLYRALVGEGLQIPHEEADLKLAPSPGAYRVLRPEPIPFISYPYEWSFSQLRDAALATLRIQGIALRHGMCLKDASAYNIQFRAGRPVLIDSLSLEKRNEGEPWVAYRQFCEHFLAPLALMSYRDVRLGQLLRSYLEGIPLDLASSLLPLSTRLRFSLASHIHLHASVQKRASRNTAQRNGHRISQAGFLGLMQSLEKAVERLRWKPEGTVWADYYDKSNYSAEAFEEKERLVREFLGEIQPRVVWDLGANVGRFSRVAARAGAFTVAFDLDPAAVELNYLECKRSGDTRILPLLLDLANPSPGTGWSHTERASLVERGPADAVLCLALVHHLAIGHNLPLGKIAEFLAMLGPALVIEFVPKEDAQTQRLLATRRDIFDGYRQDAFEAAFGQFFRLRRSEQIRGTQRTLYLMQKERAA
jgi:hypothetical protein